MGKFVTLDVEAEIKRTMAKVNVFAKLAQGGCNVGDVTYDRVSFNTICIGIVNDGLLGFDLALVLKKFDRVHVLEVKEHEGSYDWKADVYCRPESSVLVKFAP
jgi:hypothetical protein